MQVDKGYPKKPGENSPDRDELDNDVDEKSDVAIDEEPVTPRLSQP